VATIVANQNMALDTLPAEGRQECLRPGRILGRRRADAVV
jgi:hypothetical protein